MITREKYIEIINRIMRYHEEQDELDKALKPFGYEYGFSEQDCLEQMLVDTLEAALNDTNGWTSYFLYERDGDLSKPCVREDDKYIDTSDWGKVYDLITNKGELEDKCNTCPLNNKTDSIPIFDEEEIHENCTVQILRNSITGEISVGWWPNDT